MPQNRRGRVAYTPTQKMEAVALGRIIGSEAAGKQLGITRQAIRKWMEQAGDPPELQGSEAQWQALLDLSLAKVHRYLEGPRTNAATVATIAGISERNLAQIRDRPAVPKDDPEHQRMAEIAALSPEERRSLGERIRDTLRAATRTNDERAGRYRARFDGLKASGMTDMEAFDFIREYMWDDLRTEQPVPAPEEPYNGELAHLSDEELMNVISPAPPTT